MENSIAMNGGDGPESYFRNSKFQGQRLNRTMELVRSGIEEFLEPKNGREVFRIADLGCSVGPNTFFCVNKIIEAVQNKYSTANHGEVPEFHVFFNDTIVNDFNTLFRALPTNSNNNNKQYMVAGVPGSLNGRLFPKASMNLMHSSVALHWLTSVPKEVTMEDSPLWNKGRVTYALSCSEIGEAFRAQFFRDMEAFFRARSEELIPGGLLLIVMPGRSEGSLPSESTLPHNFERLGDALGDMVNEGLVSESIADSFNIPFFFPSPAEMNQVVSGTKNLRTEIVEVIKNPGTIRTPEEIRSYSLHVRVVLEDMLRKHFGPDFLIDELFDRYSRKLESFSKTPEIIQAENWDRTLFMLVQRNHDS